MTTSKRERQKAGHRARIAAERRAIEREERRRRSIRIGLAVAAVVLAGALVVVLSRGDDSTTAAPTDGTTTTAPARSVAGEPCVPLADELPAGAPDVPVPVGPPPSELVTEDLVVGSGEPAAVGDDLTIQYVGVSCSTGAIFDSSWSRGQPSEIPLTEGGLIQGWIDGIPGMQPGGRRLLVIPPELGYGAAGRGADIAPDETLVFVVDLVAATPAQSGTTAP